MVDPESLPPGQRGTYAACVRRAWRPTALEFYAFSLRDPLPAITVPLRERDADVPLDLQALIDRVDSGGRYDDIDYRTDPLPPLHEKDAAWADALLRAAGLR